MSQTDARGIETTLAYDVLGRLLTKTDVATGKIYVTNTYDEVVANSFNKGRLTTAANDNGIHKYTYNHDGNVTRKATTVDTITYVTQSTWDRTGAVIGRRYSQHPANNPAAETNIDTVGSAADPWVYDLAGNLISIPGFIGDIEYQANGDTKSIAYTNGTSTDFTYDANRQWLTNVTTTGPNGPLQDVSYTRSDTGRIDQIDGASTGLKDKWIYQYDDLDQLLSAQNLEDPSLDQTFEYDVLGNMTYNSKVGWYHYPVAGAGVVRPHAQTGIATIDGGYRDYQYDANGNMIADGIRTLNWTNDSEHVVCHKQIQADQTIENCLKLANTRSAAKGCTRRLKRQQRS